LFNVHFLSDGPKAVQNPQYSNVYEQLLFWLHSEKIDKNHILNILPSQVSMPLREVIRFCKLNLSQVSTTQWPEDLYKLIDREDFLKNINSQQMKSKDHILDMDQLIGLAPAKAPQSQATKEKDGYNSKQSQSDQGQFVEFLINRFSQDSRYKEILNLLSSSKDMTIKNRYFKPDYEQLDAAQQMEARKKILERLFTRQLSRMVGRGLLSVGTLGILSTEMLIVPPISQVGQIPSANSSMQVENNEEESKKVLQWPQFHNGAAEAMRIAINLSQQKNKEANFVRNWIMQHKPATPKPEHAGFLLSLGLFGLLDCLQNTDIYQHLKSLHDSTTIGILLGKACSKLGSMDPQYTKTLCMHITYLQPPNLYADVSLPVQSAAVIGAGLLFKGTRYRPITEMLLA
jgi:anaphase-promoting complex subunit 1